MDARIERLASLIVDFAANVQPDQIVDVWADVGKEDLARAVTAASYRRGAKFVDVTYYDPYVKRARLENVRDESLEYIPPWHGERVLALGREHAAAISFSGPSAPHLFDDLDPTRLGRDVYPRVKQWTEVTNDRTVNWCIAPCPTGEWAQLVHPDLEDGAALETLWGEIERVCRLDEPDPAASWRERGAMLRATAAQLTERRLDALHFAGDGTDLTVGLLPSSRWVGGGDTTVDGVDHLANLPTEEVFTAPDPERTEGTVRATKPFILYGATIEGLRVRFEGGRAVQIDADQGEETLRELVRRDDGASRLGEVALVDREGRVGKTGTLFYDVLLDENAASHVALGDAYATTAGAEDQPRLNHSELHIDFMIGGDDVDVTGLTREGDRVPLLRGGSWQV